MRHHSLIVESTPAFFSHPEGKSRYKAHILLSLPVEGHLYLSGTSVLTRAQLLSPHLLECRMYHSHSIVVVQSALPGDRVWLKRLSFLGSRMNMAVTYVEQFLRSPSWHHITM